MSAHSTRTQIRLGPQSIRGGNAPLIGRRTMSWKLQLGASARIAIGGMLVLSPWAAYLLNLLHGIVDALGMLAAVFTGLLLVASGLLHMQHNAESATRVDGLHRALHGAAVLGAAILLLLMTARALGA